MEANFIGEVGDIYKCIVCHFVLKDPVLIIECGHRLCKLCFESLKKYATDNKKSVLCPHDRKEVDADKVVDDKGIARTVLDLKVQCNNNREGCTWSGELRQLDEHVDKWCHVTSVKKFMEKMEMRFETKDTEMEELQGRMVAKDDQLTAMQEMISSTKELVLRETDKRILVEQRLKDVEGQLREKNEEIAYLKYELASLRVEVLSDIDKNSSGVLPGSKKRKLRSVLIDSGRQNQGNSDMENIENMGEAVMVEKRNEMEDLTALKREIKELDKKVARIELRNMSFNNDILRLQDTKVQEEDIRSETKEVDKDCTADCIHCEQHRNVVERLMNVHRYVPNKRTEFVWKLKHYSYCEKVGKNVASPKFYSSLHGHCCCLFAGWSKEKSFGLYFRICSGLQDPDDVFAMSVSLSATNIDGLQHECILTEQEVRNNLIKYTIMPGETESTGRGFVNFLAYPGLEDFIINDVLTVVCVLSDD